MIVDHFHAEMSCTCMDCTHACEVLTRLNDINEPELMEFFVGVYNEWRLTSHQAKVIDAAQTTVENSVLDVNKNDLKRIVRKFEEYGYSRCGLTTEEDFAAFARLNHSLTVAETPSREPSQ